MTNYTPALFVYPTAYASPAPRGAAAGSMVWGSVVICPNSLTFRGKCGEFCVNFRSQFDANIFKNL